ncbi:CheR family methyltransferase [Methylobacterium oxalidis]|uniref:CheR family methyltransferase n=1 Tax=Methylobacterium oxalidis TaxID=944322 RepID=UPI0038B3D5C0
MARDPSREQAAARRAERRDPFADPGYAALKADIVARTGHHYYVDKDGLLFERLCRRFRATGAADATAYRALLGQGQDGAREWAALEAEITIGETFFFRYAEQFDALRDTILPGLVATREPERSLKIWSAGCSTGAEPYSVAILVHEILGEALPDWHVAITGTDISVAALATARAAEYGRWALRTLPAEARNLYFRRTSPEPGTNREGGYALRPEFRRMVRFEQRNLLALLDGTAPAHLAEFDLILCRNVLIYFSAETVAGIVRALGRRLRPGGWLLIGHAEPNPTFADWLTPVSLPGTVAYRRLDEAAPLGGSETPPLAGQAPRAAQAPQVIVTPVPAADERSESSSAPAASSWEPRQIPDVPAEEPRAAGEILPPLTLPGASWAPEVPLPEDATPDDVLAWVRELADSGQTAEAWRGVRAALEAGLRDPRLLYYEGLLGLSLGREAEAERALRGALYLDPGFVMAHYHLGLLLAGLGRARPARRALDNAARLSEALRPDTVLPESDGASAREIAESARLAQGRIGGRA